jgi:hypothetical protein
MRHQSFDAAGAGASETGACLAEAFGAACFLAATAAAAGRGDGDGVPAAGAEAAERGAGGAKLGSGVMMLTGGVEAALGKSALVGLPVGIVGDSVATGAAGAVGGGAFHSGA